MNFLYLKRSSFSIFTFYIDLYALLVLYRSLCICLLKSLYKYIFYTYYIFMIITINHLYIFNEMLHFFNPRILW